MPLAVVMETDDGQRAGRIQRHTETITMCGTFNEPMAGIPSASYEDFLATLPPGVLAEMKAKDARLRAAIASAVADALLEELRPLRCSLPRETEAGSARQRPGRGAELQTA